jgi:hypothetical protein
MAPNIGRYAREVGCGLLDIGTCGDDADDGADSAGALGDALLRRLAETGVL